MGHIIKDWLAVECLIDKLVSVGHIFFCECWNNFFFADMLAKYFTEKNIEEKREEDGLEDQDHQDVEELSGDTEINEGSGGQEEEEAFSVVEEEEEVEEINQLMEETAPVKEGQVENRELMHNCFNSLVNDLNKQVRIEVGSWIVRTLIIMVGLSSSINISKTSSCCSLVAIGLVIYSLKIQVLTVDERIYSNDIIIWAWMM